MHTFKDIVELHVNRMLTIRWKFLTERISEEAYNTAIMAERMAWYDICSGLDDRGYVVTPVKELTAQDLKTYNVLDGFPLIGLLHYRGVTVPMYNDDYGQQVFAKWNGREVSGGAYNPYYCEEFVMELDREIDNARIEAYDREYLDDGE